MAGWEEVGRGVFCRRYEPWDVTVGAIVGRDGLLVVDTRATPSQAGELLDDLGSLDPRPPAWVVNTHAHFDHSFGNSRFAEAGVEIWGHRSVPTALAAGRHEAPDDAEHREVSIAPPDHLVSSRACVDLGDRTVELHHLGRAHTDGDLVVWVPDAGVLFTGDLIEESGPSAYGADSFPLDWPDALRRLVDWERGEDLRFVPGHGAVVDREFVERQRRDVAAVARLLAELLADGVAPQDVLAAGGDRWPWPARFLEHAVRRAVLQRAGVSGGGGSGG
jgi:glyoxylase-like metal-dependent hydrolase (beta-lactamase superfamily II)